LSRLPGSTRVLGEVLLGPDHSLPAAFYVFRAPHSYTREDLVEIHTIGTPPLLELVRRRALGLGAIPAQPGEFTARAFLNGAMDLAKAEAVAGVIRARSDAQLRASRRIMEGALSKKTIEARDTLAELAALVEADIDFSDEPIDFITPDKLRRQLARIVVDLEGLLADAPAIERLDVLPRVLLLGPPNAGKSSLMNRLSGTNRAIIAAAAGTTRDVLSAPIRIGRGEAVLLDAAGVDRSSDSVLAAAREAALAAAEQVDLVCLVVDVSATEPRQFVNRIKELDLPKVVVAANKLDLITEDQAGRQATLWEGHQLGPVCLVSALTGAGVDRLRQALAEPLAELTGSASAEGIFLSERQRNALRNALDALRRGSQLSESPGQPLIVQSCWRSSCARPWIN
ncbi:MAG: 50S ribosome-binding GTPase, partial [Planctomycetes bacterium]|nr:50S ribosome-binding GTPase [Planctomycetota bacterium]